MDTRWSVVLTIFMCCIPTLRGILWSPASNLLLSGSKGHLRYIGTVSSGIDKAVKECRHQFKWDRWNCPDSTVYNNPDANREMSFVQAIASAGVMYSITRNCSEGVLENCGCDDTQNKKPGGDGWTWGGCSDNVRFGERTSTDIMDASEKSQDALTVMRLHNHEAGRRAVKQTIERTCKCHGVSGSCTMQTCWKQLATFRSIGAQIKRKYFKAVRVDFISGRLIDSNRAEDRGPRGSSRDQVTAASRRDLVFLNQSPDYCRANLSIGVAGTAGRECFMKGDEQIVDPLATSPSAIGAGDSSSSSSPSSDASDRWMKQSCSRLCMSCGMEVRTTRVTVTTSCNCNFVWCCSVKCDTCRRTVVKRICQPIGFKR
uniref:Protein Wnt n=1 Tax=Peronella japonica TaxID=262331 RepID=B9U3V0_9ECHN|nr:Wnt8 [Peronella japonica]